MRARDRPSIGGSGRSARKRAKGIEPSSVAWKAAALPLSYARGLRLRIAAIARHDRERSARRSHRRPRMPAGRRPRSLHLLEPLRIPVRGARSGAPRTPDRASYGDRRAAVSATGDAAPGKGGRMFAGGAATPAYVSVNPRRRERAAAIPERGVAACAGRPRPPTAESERRAQKALRRFRREVAWWVGNCRVSRPEWALAWDSCRRPLPSWPSCQSCS